MLFFYQACYLIDNKKIFLIILNKEKSFVDLIY